jgi:hypothetical protein
MAVIFLVAGFILIVAALVIATGIVPHMAPVERRLWVIVIWIGVAMATVGPLAWAASKTAPCSQGDRGPGCGLGWLLLGAVGAGVIASVASAVWVWWAHARIRRAVPSAAKETTSGLAFPCAFGCLVGGGLFLVMVVAIYFA